MLPHRDICYRSNVMSHKVRILTPGQPVLELTLRHQGPGRVSHWNTNFEMTGMTRPGKIPMKKAGTAEAVLYVLNVQATSKVSEELVVGCLTSQQHVNVSQGRICSDNFTCCHTETEVADPTLHLTQSMYTYTRPTSQAFGRVSTRVPIFKSLV